MSAVIIAFPRQQTPIDVWAKEMQATVAALNDEYAAGSMLECAKRLRQTAATHPDPLMVQSLDVWVTALNDAGREFLKAAMQRGVVS